MILSFRLFKTLSIPNRKSWGATIMREYSHPHHVSHVMCHLSCVMCHVSCVTFHLSVVTYQVSHDICQRSQFFFIFFYNVLELIGAACVINGAYSIIFYVCLLSIKHILRPLIGQYDQFPGLSFQPPPLLHVSCC